MGLHIDALKAAHDLLVSNSDSLSYACATQEIEADTTFYRFAERNVIFSSIESLTQCAALFLYQQFESSESPISIDTFKTAQRIRLKNKKLGEHTSGLYLSLVFSSKNIFSAVTDIINTLPPPEVFTALDGLASALLYVPQATPHDLIEVSSAQFEKTKRDFLAGRFFSKLRDYFVTAPELSDQLVDLLSQKYDEKLAALYKACISSIAQRGNTLQAINIAIRDSNSDTKLAVTAIATIGMLASYSKGNSKQLSKLKHCLLNHIDNSEEKLTNEAYFSLAELTKHDDSCLPVLLGAATNGNQASQSALQNFLFESSVDKDNQIELARKILPAIVELNSSRIGELDYTLSELVSCSSDGASVVVDWLTSWLLNNISEKASDETFSNLFQQSISSLHNTKQLSPMLTTWLLSDERKLGIGFHDVTSYLWVHNIREIELDKKQLSNLKMEDWRYLTRRTWAWATHEDTLLSLCWSMLNVNDAKEHAFPWVYQLLTKYVGVNYPKATSDWLEHKLVMSNKDDLKNFVQKVKSDIDGYIEKLDNLPIRRELSFPSSIREEISLIRETKTRESQEKAEKISIVRQLSQQIPLKSGTGFFSFRDGKLSEISRLKSFEHSATLPINSVLDPVNDTIERLFFRNTVRDED